MKHLLFFAIKKKSIRYNKSVGNSLRTLTLILSVLLCGQSTIAAIDCSVQISSVELACQGDPSGETCRANKIQCIKSCQDESSEYLNRCQSFGSSTTSEDHKSCVSSMQGPHTLQTAQACVSACQTTTPQSEEVQTSLAHCQAEVARLSGASTRVAAAEGTPLSPLKEGKPDPANDKSAKPADARPKGTPDPKADGPQQAGNSDQTPPPNNFPNNNPFKDFATQGIAATPSASTDIHIPQSANFSGGPSADPGGYKTASDGVSAGSSGGPTGNFNLNRPFDRAEPFAHKPADSGGASPSTASQGGGGGMMGQGGGGGPAVASKKPSPGPSGGSSMNQQVGRLGQNTFYGAGGSMSNPPRGTSLSSAAKVTAPIKNTKKSDDGALALTRLFGITSKSPLLQGHRFSGFIPAGGMSCLNTVFCQMENYFDHEVRSPSSEWDTSQ